MCCWTQRWSYPNRHPAIVQILGNISFSKQGRRHWIVLRTWMGCWTHWKLRKPMQKLHALRSQVIPMLHLLLEMEYIKNSSSALIVRWGDVQTNFVSNQKNNQSYIHLHGFYGDPWLPDLVLLKGQLKMQSFIPSRNLFDELGEYIHKLQSRGLNTP